MNNKDWDDTVLQNLPHGEEGHFQCSFEDACMLTKLLLKYGYAVCITGGDFGDDVCVHWLYAGEGDDLDYADYNNVVFSSVDYLMNYPEAVYSTREEEDSEEEN